MTINTKNLRTLAEAATRGPYDTMAGMPSNVLTDGGLRVARCDFDGTFNAQTAANGRYFAACSPNVVLALLDALERKDRLLNAACNALQLQPRQTREVWKDGIDIDIAVPHTKARDAAIEAITKELK